MVAPNTDTPRRPGPRAGRRPRDADPDRLEADDRQRRAWELRVAGASFDEIARQLGYADHSGARLAVLAWRAKVRESCAAEVEVERDLEATRLDRVFLDLWSARSRRVPDGVDEAGRPRYRAEVDVGVVDRIVRVMERRARLMGLDAADLRDDERVRLEGIRDELLVGVFEAAIVGLFGRIGVALTEEVHAAARHEIAEVLRGIRGDVPALPAGDGRP